MLHEIELKTEFVGDLIIISAMWMRRQRVGVLSAMFYGDRTAHLQDVLVEDSIWVKRGLFDRLLLRLRSKSFRGHGIGSGLLTEFIRICRNKGIQCVVGSVVQRDLDAIPKLLSWYAERGFRRRELIENPEPEWFRPPHTICEVVWVPHKLS